MDAFRGHIVYVQVGEAAATRSHRNLIRRAAVATSLVALAAVVALVSSSSGPSTLSQTNIAAVPTYPTPQELHGVDQLLNQIVRISQKLAESGNSTPTEDDLYKQAIAEQDSLPGSGNSSTAEATPTDPLWHQAVAEQGDLPEADGRSMDDLTDQEKALIEEAKKLGEADYLSPDTGANLTMSEEIQDFIKKMEAALADGTMKDPLDQVNITDKVDPIPAEIIASAKQAEDEMKLDDQTAT
mmetsp:Transcript_23089/g.36133  ORF Transcript_23089/g.36133 Transcript_23089/m.36133 type:complete len:241 (+) Transcript_23089:352-1074(+)